MVLVDPRKLEALQKASSQSPPPPPPSYNVLEEIDSPVTSALRRLDQEMRDILDNETYTEDEKIKLYNQTLQRYLEYKRQRLYNIHHPPPPRQLEAKSADAAAAAADDDEKINRQLVEKDIIDSVPQTYQRKARLLIDRLKRSRVIGWKDDGRLVYKDEVVPNTHITDLVNDAVRSRKRFEPYGWRIFAQGLSDSNVPQELVGNKRRWDYIRRQRGELTSEQGDSGETLIPARWINY